ncbi:MULTISPECIES: oligopeptide/dipeptide ABC transporter ATP-binding protein [unclassified Microbacterium]|uniref:ABC transporter ATP-binding protein n=1 Tax=unclassified Microbacterium TaxID=2609290 RepID=UPI00214C0688|nr:MULTISPECIES: oligopeptide/dipeptide ABC transporter ATP-binding protein [unclassified Microbacterium]MCR2811258.1 ATP-binding cassette domain-containing protein [Microbacterium sp. zg.B185]WIM19857.1 ATP-binding cassette domain-containing protein [Microbacterium sp. zg-B185]
MTQIVDERSPQATGSKETLLSVRHIVQEYVSRGPGNIKAGVVHAVSDVSFELGVGETLGVVGETGSGKSTLARAAIQVERPKSGEVWFKGRNLVELSRRDLKAARRDIQMVYQDPFGSLNPKWRVEDVVAEPLVGHTKMGRVQRRARVRELLDLVGLNPDIYLRRRPLELSGGQAQRVAIARAIATNPALVVCDEAISSLDVLIQAQVMNLFEKLRAEFGLSYVFIAHDLARVKQLSDQVAVMHLGQLAEIGPAEQVYATPRHPYTRALLDSIPGLDPETGIARRPVTLKGEPPSPLHPPSGCRFRTRCPRAQDKCAVEEPLPRDLGGGHKVACHFPLEVPTISVDSLRASIPAPGAKTRTAPASA